MMENLSTTYNGTDLLEIKDNINSDSTLQAEHYQYISPALECDIKTNTATFNVIITTQFEYTNPILPYRLSTESNFSFKNFVLHTDSFIVLEDYIFFAYKKHKEILREKLNNQNYINKIKPELELGQYQSSIETFIYRKLQEN